MAVNKISIFIAVFAIILISGCTSNNLDEECSGMTCNAAANLESEREISIDKLEVYHFHGTNQCYSCKTVGDYAEETINTYFADELKSGKIVFAHINGEFPENLELVKKYGATGSSLWLGTYSGEEFKAEQNTNVWYKISNKQEYMDYLKGVIEQKLAGN